MVHLDQATLLKLPEATATLVVGNPLIADAAVQGGAMVITAKSYGMTNLMVLGNKGETLEEYPIQVVGPTDKLVTVYRGIERETYSCAPKCEKRITLGDSLQYFTQNLSAFGTFNAPGRRPAKQVAAPRGAWLAARKGGPCGCRHSPQPFDNPSLIQRHRAASSPPQVRVRAMIGKMQATLRGAVERSLSWIGARRIVREQDGATTVEFALLVAPFLAIIFAIIETAIVFFAGQTLETANADSARLIMTGQAQTQGFSQAQFKNAVCARIYGLFNCAGGLYVDVKTYTGVLQHQQFAASGRRQRQPANRHVRLSARRPRRHRRGAADLPVAGLRVAARAQPLQLRGQQARHHVDRRVPQRTVRDWAMSFVLDHTARIVESFKRKLGGLAGDKSGIAAVEFAMLLPLMLSLWLGAVELSQGIAADRKVTLTARTVSDLVSQVTSHHHHRHGQFAERGDRGDGAVFPPAI